MRDILSPVVVECSIPGTSPGKLFIVSIHESVGVEIILNYGKARFAGCNKRILNLPDLFIASFTSVNHIVETSDHHVDNSKALFFKRIHNFS